MPQETSEYIGDARFRGVRIAEYMAGVDDLLAKIEHEVLIPSEVANFMRVDPKTVTRWANDNKIFALRTLGGHRRFRKRDVRIEMLKVFMKSIGCTEDEIEGRTRTEEAVNAIPAQRDAGRR